MSKIKALIFGISTLNIIKDRGIIIADTGCFTEKETYKEAFKKEEIDPKDIKLIVLTHGHWDHFARVRELKELTNAPVLCHKNALQSLKDGDKLNYKPRGEDGKKFLEMLAGDKPDFARNVIPDIVIDSDFDLNPYGVSGKIVHTPGHSDCSVSVVLDSGDAVVGDMLLNSPFNGELCLALIVSDENQLKESIKKLLNTVHTFYGGHGGPYTKDQVLKLIF